MRQSGQAMMPYTLGLWCGVSITAFRLAMDDRGQRSELLVNNTPRRPSSCGCQCEGPVPSHGELVMLAVFHLRGFGRRQRMIRPRRGSSSARRRLWRGAANDRWLMHQCFLCDRYRSYLCAWKPGKAAESIVCAFLHIWFCGNVSVVLQCFKNCPSK